ncbi:hypothetical protein K0M31_019418 [Melipona bicolor]|uniref:Uncharacterized protein n=1 Tax=Melipona bicolor TaxID=60889 RepID=A0AA40KR64_9HYME|nr:hypothetical protein K0M31_019418 [Melipona bicolor]
MNRRRTAELRPISNDPGRRVHVVALFTTVFDVLYFLGEQIVGNEESLTGNRTWSSELLARAQSRLSGRVCTFLDESIYPMQDEKADNSVDKLSDKT